MKLTAQPVLAGYLYQFQQTAIELVKASSAARITIEATQDLEVHTPTEIRSIQYKYLPSKSLCPSTIGPPIRELYTDWKNDRDSLNHRYELHIYTGLNSDYRFDSFEALKELLPEPTSPNSKLKIKNSEFLKSFTLIKGKTLYESYDELILALTRKFAAPIDITEDHLYPKTIASILTIGSEPNITNRTTTAASFWRAIDIPRQTPRRKSLIPQTITRRGLQHVQLPEFWQIHGQSEAIDHTALIAKV